MYSFSKTNKSPRGSRAPAECQVWEFSHPKFHRDHPEMLEEMRRKAHESSTDTSGKNQSTNIAVNQLQTQLGQVLLSMKSMQEQFTEVVRELNDVKRKSAIHQLMMKNVLDFLNRNINPETESRFHESLTALDYQELSAMINTAQKESNPCTHTWGSGNLDLGMGILLPDHAEIIPANLHSMASCSGTRNLDFSPTPSSSTTISSQPPSPYLPISPEVSNNFATTDCLATTDYKPSFQTITSQTFQL